MPSLAPINLKGTFFEDDDDRTLYNEAEKASNALQITSHVVITDAKELITKVSAGFLQFTGYTEDEFMGRKCNFLQGKGTDPSDIMDIKEAVITKRQRSVAILNYCKDGNPFWNILSVKPLYLGKAGELTNFLGEIISIPVPDSMKSHPKLCIDDAMQLIQVFSTIPRSIQFNKNEKVTNTVIIKKFEAARDQVIENIKLTKNQDSSRIYRHKNYMQLLGQNKVSHLAGGFISDAPAGPEEDRPSNETDHKYEFVAETSLPTHKGRFRMRAYRDVLTGEEPLAMIVGLVEDQEEVIVRVHDQCVTSEVFGSLRCDCKEQLHYALGHMQDCKLGMVLYLPQEGRGIGLANKVAAYAMQETGLDTVDANRHLGLPDDARQYASVRDILNDLNVKSIRLMTNNPRKVSCLESLGVKIVGREPCIVNPNSQYSMDYVAAKAKRMGHMIDVDALGR